MGGSQSKTQLIMNNTEQEQTLRVTPSQILQVCMTLARAQIEVVATSVPAKSKEHAIIWVKHNDQLNAILESGGLGDDVEPVSYLSKGTKVTTLDDNTTAIDMLQRCEEMANEGIDVRACSSMASLGQKFIYHT
jgi:hypothetical protein